MKRITRYALLAVVALVAPIAAGGPQAPQAQAPQPSVREIATIPVAVDDIARLPNGKVVLYAASDSIFAYDLASKRSTLVTRGFLYDLAVSQSGNRIAFCRASDSGDNYIWSMPINPTTGEASGPAQRVSLSRGDSPSLSPDGKQIAFALDRPQGQALAVVLAVGGPERILGEYRKRLSGGAWSDDGMSIYLQVGLNASADRSFERVPVAGGKSVPLTALSPSTGRARGQIAGEIAFYLPRSNGQGEGRIAYVAMSGARGEFSIPAGADGGIGSAKSLLRKTTKTSEGQPATTVYELDVSPILQRLGIR